MRPSSLPSRLAAILAATVMALAVGLAPAAGSESELADFGTPTTTPAITGTVAVGSTVSIKAPTYPVAPSAHAYQWRRDGKAISRATSSSYKLATADAGARISVAVTSTRPGYVSATWVSAGKTVPLVFTQAPKPSISGTPTVGSILTAKIGTWSPKPSASAYRWYRDGKAISGATKTTYRTTSADAGRKVTVAVTAKRSGYTTKATTSSPVTVGRKITVGTPTIAGTPKVGNTLTVKRGTWGPGSISTKVQWYVSGKAVKGATSSTYKVKPADTYKSVTVKVTGSRSGYTSASKTSSAKKPTGVAYENCTAMRKHYPDGVAKSSSVRDKVSGKIGGKITSKTFVSASLYSINIKSDRDKDGWACEP